jgi:hypothetical protein
MVSCEALVSAVTGENDLQLRRGDLRDAECWNGGAVSEWFIVVFSQLR